MPRTAFAFGLLISATSLLASCQSEITTLAASTDVRDLSRGGQEKSERRFGYDTKPVAQLSPVRQEEAGQEKSRDCADDLVSALLAPDTSPVKITCSVTLPAGAVVSRQVLFEGDAVSGSTLDCNGGRLMGEGPKGDSGSVLVKSKQQRGTWSRPNGVTVTNCEIIGGVRIYGLGRNGEAENVKQSSVNRDHTAFAQSAAPTNVIFDRVHIKSSGGSPFYVSPGATRVSLTNSRIEGKSSGTAIYLDAESANNRIVNNTFDIATKSREIIAVDGSADNEISGNTFNAAANGGIFLYRNCGEGGTIRHQAPQHNRIEGNIFKMGGGKSPAVWLNSRNGNRSYCFIDPAHPFGSSLTSRDLAQDNTVENNSIIGARDKAIRNDDPSNRVNRNSQ
jgi:parallel beta-helix repeat protein